MKSSLVLLLLASALVVGCAGSNPIAPDPASVSSVKDSATGVVGSGAPRTAFPPIGPEGISCPSDAPEIAVGSLGLRLDVDYSPVAGAYAYEIEILDRRGETTRLEVPAPSTRAEWYGVPGTYRVRVRTINCGGLGKWSVEAFTSLDEGRVPETTPPVPPPTLPPPPVEPQCMVGCF